VHVAPAGRDYATDAVKTELLADSRLGDTPAARYQALFTGGLQIHTTIDPALEHQAQAAITSGLPGGHDLTAAEISIDPATGAIRSVAGGADFATLQFNTALTGAGRQPGSSFKVFTLVAALEAGYSPDDLIDGSTPCAIANPHGTPDPWLPDNYEGENFGWMSLTDATAYSVNCAYARLAITVGLNRVADVAHAMGITSHLNVVPSMTLGTNEVTPLQMASAYATLANDGVYHTPYLVEAVQDSGGKVLFTHTDKTRQAIPVQIARQATQVLQQVVLRGTGVAAAVNGHPVAGKTGTAENYHDAWFVGFTPQISTAVWMGNVAGEVPMRNIEGIDVVGGSFPARIWHHYMTAALAPLPSRWFPPPDPAQIPAPVTVVDGQSRMAAGQAAAAAGPKVGAAGQTQSTTWCSASCSHR
jgi:penicillin-binding protein 1A